MCVAYPTPAAYYGAMIPRPCWPFIAILLLVLACAPGNAGPEATSLLGEPLHPPDLHAADAARMEAQLDSARAAHRAGGGADALIWVGRRLAYPGRYRDAIAVFTDGIEQYPHDPRFYRHRGHRYITVREFGNAIQDLEHAVHLVGDDPDEVEPDGQPNQAGIPLSTLHTNIWYHLGLARYLEADFERAAHAFRVGLDISPNDDMRVAMADWLWLALMRVGRTDEAGALLDFVTEDMVLLENRSYHRRLLRYKSLVSDAALVGSDAGEDAVPTSALDAATLGYGAGAWHLIQGDTARAMQLFQQVRETGSWAAFGFIAAEAEIARLGRSASTSRE